PLTPAARSAPTPKPPAPKIDAQADKYLKQMCSFLAGQKSFSFTAEESVEEARAGGQVVELSNRRHVTVSRPNRLAADALGDMGSRQFFYDGKTATLYARKANVYATQKAPPTIQARRDDMF